jgi:hypothetical protein
MLGIKILTLESNMLFKLILVRPIKTRKMSLSAIRISSVYKTVVAN